MVYGIALVLAVLVLAFLLGWKLLPAGKLTIAWLGSGAVVELLTYLAGFHWREALPSEQAIWVSLVFALLAIVARTRGSLT